MKLKIAFVVTLLVMIACESSYRQKQEDPQYIDSSQVGTATTDSTAMIVRGN